MRQMLGFEFAWYLAKLICASQHTQGLAAKKITSEKEGKGPDYVTGRTAISTQQCLA